MAVLALFMASCSSDDSQSANSEDTLLLKKMVITDEDGVETTYDYNYDGHKLIGISGPDGYYESYTYVGNQITYTKSVSSEVTIEDFFEYNNDGKIKSDITKIIYPENDDTSYDFTTTYTYIYNNDGSVSATSVTEFTELGQISEENYTILYSESDNSIVYDYGSNTTYNYIYDGKNAPLKNVTGIVSNLNKGENILKGIIHDSSGEIIVNDNTYEYNTMNFPISAIIKTNSGFNFNVQEIYHYQYFYE